MRSLPSPAGINGLLHGSVLTQIDEFATYAYSGNEVTPAKNDALNTACIVPVITPISHILRDGHKSEIGYAIIEPVPVDVIDIHVLGYGSVVNRISNSMGREHAPARHSDSYPGR